MRTIKLSAASRSLAEYARELTEEIVVLTDRNRPVAAVVPLRGINPEGIRLSGHPTFLKIVSRSRAEIRRGRTVSLADMKAAFGPKSPAKRLPPTKARKVGAKRRARARLRG